MATVSTIRGPVDVDDLGPTLMHEHVFVVNEEYRRNYPEHWDEQQRFDDAVTKLRALTDAGVRTIVDPTVLGLGRDVERVARINEQVDLHIVPATGLYTYRDLPFVFSLTGPGTMLGGEEPMTPLFVKDLTEGIAGTGIKAAFLKCAIEAHGLTEGSSGCCTRSPTRTRRPARRSPCTPTPSRSRGWSCSGCSVSVASTSPRSSSGTAATPPTWTTSSG
ncbi:hypothetical protein GCM10025872_34260 [Barrientosiimonas endolithica]|uniref:Phosphotriesterase family protein n=1 Tax=Barrientosiimonas endolithica TaxID=1535208 RepID=A0ABN6YS00_9MICO|nr:hypothetical protein GCM10025872_34260 [Barrientosiimonas endolithica]